MKTMTLIEAQECANRLIAAGHVCGGCKFFSRCGMGEQNATALGQLLSNIDPGQNLAGQNLTLIPLKPFGQGE